MVSGPESFEPTKEERDVSIVSVPGAILPGINFDGMLVVGADPNKFPELKDSDDLPANPDDET